MSNTWPLTGQIMEGGGTAAAVEEAPRAQVGEGPQIIPGRINDLLDMPMRNQVAIVHGWPWIIQQAAEPHEGEPWFSVWGREESISTRRRLQPSVWDSPKLRQLLEQPLGSPIELSPDEAREIAKLAFGRRGDLPEGRRFVREVRELLGHSVIERLQRTNG
jgi:hypothetical protein